MAKGKQVSSDCVNCTNPGFYLYRMSPTQQYWYCATCLPRFLYAQRDAGLLPSSEALMTTQAEVLDILKPVFEETPISTPITTTKKKISSVEPDSE